jgi:hypothetical protein
VLSLFGVMFAADDVRAAHELMRICEPRGRIGLANWTPGGFMGRVFAALARHAPPSLARTFDMRWGDEDHLEHLFRASGCDLHVSSSSRRVSMPLCSALRSRAPVSLLSDSGSIRRTLSRAAATSRRAFAVSRGRLQHELELCSGGSERIHPGGRAEEMTGHRDRFPILDEE